MAKAKPSTTMTLHSKSTPAERESADRAHKTEMINSTLDVAAYGQHGHIFGKSGPGNKGHVMPKSDAHLQGDHAYIPQGVASMGMKDGGTPFDDNQQAADDYGKVDE